MIEINALRERLCDMGFETEENEEAILLGSIKRAEQTILNFCNCESVPEELYFAALDMAAGEYLLAAKSREGDFDGVEKISEGDLSLSFSEEPTESLIDRLFSEGREEMLSFRRLKW